MKLPQTARRVVITGMSAISPLGSSWADVRSALLHNRSGVQHMTEWEDLQGLNTRVGAPAAPFELDPEFFTRKRTRSMGRVAQMAVKTARDALRDANLLDSPEVSSPLCGVSFGSSAGQPRAVAELAHMILTKSCRGITATTYVRMMSHTAPVNISVAFGCKGRISTNWNDDPTHTPRPFDRRRDGLVVGEGSGALILEELEHARARGARIYAEILGYGTNADGEHITSPASEQMAAAMRLALDDAGLAPKDIDLINGHGTATDRGDLAESKATYDVFGGTVPYTTYKGHMGHTLGACGALEAIFAVHAMMEGFVSPILNLEEPDPECAPLDFVVGGVRELEQKIIMSNNFAFGGINTSLIFRKWPTDGSSAKH